MGDQVARTEQAVLEHGLDVASLAERLDRMDVLLLKEFYYTGEPYPHDTTPQILRVLVNTLHRGSGPLARRSYSSIRHRLDNLVALGLIGKVAHSNPASYYPLDWARYPVRRIIQLFAADFVGLWKSHQGEGL